MKKRTFLRSSVLIGWYLLQSGAEMRSHDFRQLLMRLSATRPSEYDSTLRTSSESAISIFSCLHEVTRISYEPLRGRKMIHLIHHSCHFWIFCQKRTISSPHWSHDGVVIFGVFIRVSIVLMCTYHHYQCCNFVLRGLIRK